MLKCRPTRSTPSLSFIKTLSYLVFVCALVLTMPSVWADEDEYDSWTISGDTKIWFDKSKSIRNVKSVMLAQVADETNANKLSPEVLETLTSIIKIRIEKSGIEVLSSNLSVDDSTILLEPLVTKYESGSAADRWILPGSGATECIMRTRIISPDQHEVIGEIITWKSVSSGGLFSLGAHKYVPKSAAESIASILTKNIGDQK